MRSFCHHILLHCACWLVYGDAPAQSSSCPPNLDFEEGNFNNWELKWGKATVSSGVNDILWIGTGESPGRHTIIPSSDNGLDEYGHFPKSCPNGSGFSVKLGNRLGGAEAEGISYQFSVPSGATKYSLFFHYAVVLQDPSHPSEEQPRFRARLWNVTDDMPLECVNFDFTASASLPGFRQSPGFPDVLYKDWTPITLNLVEFAGKTLRLEFISSDCTRNGHFGYAYVDVSSNCSGAITGSTVCDGENAGILTAPFGFESYTWYSDINFTSVLSTTQVLNLNPPPNSGTVFPVVVVPYPTFGCKDTIFASISIASKPPANAGVDQTICTYEQAQLGGPANLSYSYRWSSPELLTSGVISNPRTLFDLPGPTLFTLKVIDNETGCFKEDDVLITPIIIDTTMSVSGELVYCRDEISITVLSIQGTVDAIQWYGNSSPLPGANSSSFNAQPTSTTTYWAQLTENGCKDSTRTTVINLAPDPVPVFKLDRNLQCPGVPVNFVNESTVSGGDTLSYIWRMSDGTNYTLKNPSKIFPGPGSYDVWLKAISGQGCTDSIMKTVKVEEFCHIRIPSAFTPDNNGLNDRFTPSLSSVKTLRRFSIYDRWGNVVFTTNQMEHGWDGKYKSQPLPAGMFIWMIEYDSYQQEKIILKGTVMLIR